MSELDPLLLKRLADLLDGDAWTLGDELVDAFPVEEWGNEDGRNSGLYAELDQYGRELEREHGIDARRALNTMRDARSTAVAWPAAGRPAAAFEVLRRIRGDDRLERLERYERMSRREDGRPLTLRKFRRYRADETDRTPTPFEQRVRRAIVNAARREVLAGYAGVKREDWWLLEEIIPSMTADAGRQTRAILVRELRALASAIAKTDA